MFITFHRSLGFFTRTFHITLGFSRSFALMSVVNNLTPIQLRDIIYSGKSSAYQIIDVREPNELTLAKYPTEVINLPLTQIAEWGEKVKKGDILDKNKPTICLCKGGKHLLFIFLLLPFRIQEIIFCEHFRNSCR